MKQSCFLSYRNSRRWLLFHGRLEKRAGAAFFHIMLRGINQQVVFEDEEDKEKFTEILKRYKTVSKYEIYGYCLMNNHVHMLIRENPERIFQML